MEFKQTQHQVARGARADAESYDKLILIKRSSSLRATYQIRLLAYRAEMEHRKLIIEVRKDCRIESDLRSLARLMPKVIKIVRN